MYVNLPLLETTGLSWLRTLICPFWRQRGRVGYYGKSCPFMAKHIDRLFDVFRDVDSVSQMSLVGSFSLLFPDRSWRGRDRGGGGGGE